MAAVWGLAAVFRTLPVPLARALADCLGTAAAAVGLRKSVALDNLRQSFPGMNRSEAVRLFRRCWRHFARVGAELARLPSLSRAEIDRWIDLSRHGVIAEALKKGKGAIVVSGHFGNWEWMGGAMAKIGYPVTYVVTTQTNPLIEEWLNQVRRSAEVEIVRRRDAVRGVLDALRRNRAVAILCDQDAGREGVFVPFFGRPASTPRGPAVFHLKTGAPLVFGSAPRDQRGVVRVMFEELRLDGLIGEREADVRLIMAQVTARLEAEVRKVPEQWLWLHRRWKTAPID